MITCCDRSCRSCITYSRKRDRGVPLGRSSVAQLAVSVVSPGDRGSIVLPRHGVILPRADGYNVCHRTGLHGRQPLSGRSIAELAVTIVAPVPNCAISL